MENKSLAKIHSLKGEEREVTILEHKSDNDVIAEYLGVKYHAIFNIFVNRYYVDDIYGRIKE